MAEELLQRIYWGDILRSVNYLYGSQISYKDRSVHFENLNFASGKTIKLWKSRTNYQGDRTAPELPLLKKGVQYRLEVELQSKPANRVLVQIDFYNRQNDLIETKILRESSSHFTFPEEAFTYTIALINSGCQSLDFSYLSLYALENVTDLIVLNDDQEHRYQVGHLPSEIYFVEDLIEDTKVLSKSGL